MNARALTAFLTVMVASPAIADAPPAPPPPAPPPPVAAGCCEPFVWTGVYVGIQAGAAWGDPRWTFPTVESFNTVPAQNFSITQSGPIFGGHVGGNYQIHNLVLGAEFSYADNGEVGRMTGPLGLGGFKVNVPDLLTLVARLGYAHDQFLFYGKAGYASSSLELGAGSATGVTAHASQSESGWTVGVGFEARMISNILFGVEYSYIGLPGGRFTGVTGGTAPGIPFSIDVSGAEMQTVMARFSILFGPTACCGEGLLGKY
jgi:outer membrane immunogenic protein